MSLTASLADAIKSGPIPMVTSYLWLSKNRDMGPEVVNLGKLSFMSFSTSNLTMVIDHDMFSIISETAKGGERMETNEIISISQFKATCLAVLDKVKRTGKPVLVTRRGVPIAMIEPPPAPEMKESWLGAFKHKGKIIGDIVAPASNEAEWRVLND